MTRKTIKKKSKRICNHSLKVKSLDDIMSPHIWMIQESKLKENELLKYEASNNFQMFYLSRKESKVLLWVLIKISNQHL